MDSLKFAVLPGDGIGPEVMETALEVLGHVARKHNFVLQYEESDVGGIAIDRQGTALPPQTLEACQSSEAILFGSIGGPKWESLPPAEQPERAALLPLRKTFSLFANIRPGLLYPELVDASPIKSERIAQGIDMVVVRELTGGIYFGQPREIRCLDNGEKEAIDTMVYRTSEIERIAEVAIRTALGRNKRICSVDKANVLANSVLWRETVTAYVKENAPDIELSYLYVDNAAMQIASDPGRFDVILTGNMFGDILSDLMASVCGSLGMLASASLGTGKNSHGLPFGLYEPAGGTAPDIAGKGIANPCAQILSAALMLRHSFGHSEAADEIERAVHRAVSSGIRTSDIAFETQSVSTQQMGKAILSNIS